MKPFLKLPLAAFLFLIAGPFSGRADPPLATPHFDLYQPGQFREPPIGVLGLPLGTFAVIEGIDHPYGIVRDMPGFEIREVNGKTLTAPRYIPIYHTPMIDGHSYVLHGYETGEWNGTPHMMPQSEDLPRLQILFGFSRNFVVTSVEKVDGVKTPDAKPLDPNSPLPNPDFETKVNTAPAIGVLGLPLGTFAVIQAHSTEHFPATVNRLMVSPFDIDSVNGKRLDSQRVLSIPAVAATRDGERVTLHGYEAGYWGGGPKLPHSEDPTDGKMVQQFFQFYPQFNLTSEAKSTASAPVHTGP